MANIFDPLFRQRDCSIDISRRGLLGYAGALAAAVLAGTGRSRAQQQMSQEQAQYQDSPNGDQQCDGCRFFIEGGSCEVVEGEISPSGWCRLYQPKE